MASEQTPEAPEASHCQVKGTGEAGTRVGLIRRHSKFTCPRPPESFYHVYVPLSQTELLSTWVLGCPGR